MANNYFNCWRDSEKLGQNDLDLLEGLKRHSPPPFVDPVLAWGVCLKLSAKLLGSKFRRESKAGGKSSSSLKTFRFSSKRSFFSSDNIHRDPRDEEAAGLGVLTQQETHIEMKETGHRAILLKLSKL